MGFENPVKSYISKTGYPGKMSPTMFENPVKSYISKTQEDGLSAVTGLRTLLILISLKLDDSKGSGSTV